MPQLSRRALLAGTLAAAAGGVLGCSRNSSAAHPHVAIDVDGPVFAPIIEVAPGSTAEFTWVDLDTDELLGTGVQPSLDTAAARRVGLFARSGRRNALSEIVTMNLGYADNDDRGRFSIGNSSDHEPQPVVGIANLTLLTGLVRFCAGNTALKGHLDFSGLERLQYVECFKSSVESVQLAGCSSVIRLCFENTCLTELDLNPVRRTLKDLRAAVQRSGDAGLTLLPLEGPMEALYHYCVRDQVVHQSIPHSHLPVIEEYWVYGTRQQTCEGPTSAALTSYLADFNPLDRGSVDRILASIAGRTSRESGRLSLAGSSPIGSPATPSRSGLAHVAALRARGWDVTTN